MKDGIGKEESAGADEEDVASSVANLLFEQASDSDNSSMLVLNDDEDDDFGCFDGDDDDGNSKCRGKHYGNVDGNYQPGYQLAPSKGNMLHDMMDGAAGGRNLSLGTAINNMAKSALGAGALFMPVCFCRLGLLGGVLGTLLAFAMTISSLSFLAAACRLANVSDYTKLASIAFGPFGEIITLSCVLVILIAPLVVYLRLIGDYMFSCVMQLGLVLDAPEWFNPMRISIFIAIFVLFPLSCIQNTSKLGRLSVLGLVGMSYVLLLVMADCIYAVWQDGLWRHLSGLVLFRLGHAGVFMSTLSTIFFAFSNHLTLPLMVAELREPSPARTSRLINMSAITSCCFYLAIGIAGYLHHGEKTVEDILTAHGTSPPLPYVLGQLAVAIVSIVSYPLNVAPMRTIFAWMWARSVCLVKQYQYQLESYWAGRAQQNSRAEQGQLFHHPQAAGQPRPPTSFAALAALSNSNSSVGTGMFARHRSSRVVFLETAMIILSVLLVNHFFHSALNVFNILGAICGAPVALILPVLFYYRTEHQLQMDHHRQYTVGSNGRRLWHGSRAAFAAIQTSSRNQLFIACATVTMGAIITIHGIIDAFF